MWSSFFQILILVISIFRVNGGGAGGGGAATGVNACIDGGAVVQTKIERKMVADLELGDFVQAVAANGTLVFTEVIAFLHHDPSASGPAIRLETEDGRSLVATTEHLIFVSPRCEASFQLGRAKMMRNVEVGHCIFLRDGETLKTSRVSGMKSVRLHGLYNPVTREGTLVADDTAVSCFANLEDHVVLHEAFSRTFAFNRWATRLVSLLSQTSLGSYVAEAVVGLLGSIHLSP